MEIPLAALGKLDGISFMTLICISKIIIGLVYIAKCKIMLNMVPSLRALEVLKLQCLGGEHRCSLRSHLEETTLHNFKNRLKGAIAQDDVARKAVGRLTADCNLPSVLYNRSLIS